MTPERIAEIIRMALQGKVSLSSTEKALTKEERMAAIGAVKDTFGDMSQLRTWHVSDDDILAAVNEWWRKNKPRKCIFHVKGCTEMARPQRRMCERHAEQVGGKV